MSQRKKTTKKSAAKPKTQTSTAAKTNGQQKVSIAKAGAKAAGGTQAVDRPKAGSTGKTTAAKAPRASAINIAADLLKAEGKPMPCKAMIETMAAQGLWTSPGGKTPEATLYAAIIREIAAKGKDARFRKVERGLFECASREA